VLVNHPYRSVAKLSRKPVPCIAHRGSFSQMGASRKVGAVQSTSPPASSTASWTRERHRTSASGDRKSDGDCLSHSR